MYKIPQSKTKPKDENVIISSVHYCARGSHQGISTSFLLTAIYLPWGDPTGMEVVTTLQMSRSLLRKQKPGSRQRVWMVGEVITEESPSPRTLFVAEMEVWWNLNFSPSTYNQDFGLECIIYTIYI